MEPTEIPSRQRLNQLRLQGHFPYSPFSTRALLLFTMITLLALSGSALPILLAKYKQFFLEGLTGDLSVAVERRSWFLFTTLLLQIFSVGAAVAAGAVLICVLMSSRFLFRGNLIGFRRPSARSMISDQHYGILGNFGISLVRFAFAIALGILVWWCYTGQILGLLNRPMSFFTAWPMEFIKRNGALLAVGLLFLAIVSWVLARRTFLARNKMTRKELMSEVLE